MFILGITKEVPMAKDFYHYNFKSALEKEGWNITNDPFEIRIGKVGYEIDLGAEKLIAAEKKGQKIAVEIKNFIGPSNINEFHKAMGQYNDYAAALDLGEPERILYLAVPNDAWENFFQERVIQAAIQRMKAKIIVFDPFQEIILSWIA